MRYRCSNSKYSSYKNYGARGISVCKEWEDPETFILWALSNGWSEGLQIDRIDNNGNYTPSNCRFVNNRQNVLNQRPLKASNTLGFSGITYDNRYNGRFQARIGIRNERVNIGTFSSLIKAVLARDFYIIEHNLTHEYKLQVAI